MALLIEHYNGNWPFWLNPRQVAIITVNDTPAVVNLARSTQAALLGTSHVKLTWGSEPSPIPGLAVDVDESARTVGVKLREARNKGYALIAVVGPRNLEDGTVDVTVSGIPTWSDRKSSVKMSSAQLLDFVRQRLDAYD